MSSYMHNLKSIIVEEKQRQLKKKESSPGAEQQTRMYCHGHTNVNIKPRYRKVKRTHLHILYLLSLDRNQMGCALQYRLHRGVSYAHTNKHRTSGILADRCHRTDVHRQTLGPAPASPCCRADTGSVSLAFPETCNQTPALLQVLQKGLGLRVKGVNVLFDPSLTPHPLETRLFSCTAVLNRGRVHITSPSVSDRSGFKRRRSSVAFFLLHPGDQTPTKRNTVRLTQMGLGAGLPLQINVVVCCPRLSLHSVDAALTH